MITPTRNRHRHSERKRGIPQTSADGVGSFDFAAFSRSAQDDENQRLQKARDFRMICGAESAKIMLLHIERDKPQSAEKTRFY